MCWQYSSSLPLTSHHNQLNAIREFALEELVEDGACPTRYDVQRLLDIFLSGSQ